MARLHGKGLLGCLVGCLRATVEKESCAMQGWGPSQKSKKGGRERSLQSPRPIGSSGCWEALGTP